MPLPTPPRPARAARRLALAAALAACAGGRTPPPAARPAARPAAPHAGATADTAGVVLTLLHTNDLHGRVHLPGEPQGLAKIATRVRAVRARSSHVLLLDAGDIIHGTPEELAYGGRPVLAAMNALGYDAAAAGNHEFDFGQDAARRAAAFARFPLLSANVRDVRTGAPWGGLRPYVVREVGGVRVAVFGLTTPTTVRIQWPRTLAGITFADPVAAARALVPVLRGRERADVVVALTHLGVAADTALARAVPGIDVVLGGHSHPRPARQRRAGPTLGAQTGHHAHALGRTDLLLRPAAGRPGRYAVADVNGRGRRWWGHDGVPVPRGAACADACPDAPLLALDPALPDDSAVVAAYRPYADRLRPSLDRVLTHARAPLAREAFGRLVAEAVRAAAGVDVGVAARDQLAADGLRAGPVRVRDLYAALPAYTRQHLVVARVPAAELRRLLDTAGPAGGRGPLAVAGAPQGGAGQDAGGAPVAGTRAYTVAAPAHVVQDHLLGRPGVAILRDAPTDPTVRDAVARFLDGHAPLAAADW